MPKMWRLKFPTTAQVDWEIHLWSLLALNKLIGRFTRLVENPLHTNFDIMLNKAEHISFVSEKKPQDQFGNVFFQDLREKKVK